MTEHQAEKLYNEWQSIFPRFELWLGSGCLGFARAQEEAEAIRAKLELHRQIYGVRIKMFEKEGDKGKVVAVYGRARRSLRQSII